MRRSLKSYPYSILWAITAAAVCVHGYHLGGDDAAIYVPAIKKAADPSLFPNRTEFFMSHASLSLFPNLIGGAGRLTQIPIDWILFLFHIFSIFLLLLAARRLACACFTGEPARWSAVALLAGALTIPVAGTALLVMDPNVTARSLSTPLILLAVERFIRNQYWTAFLYLLFTLSIHPHMIVFAIALLGFTGLVRNVSEREIGDAVPAAVALAAFPITFELGPAHGVYLDVLNSRSYFFVSSWQWYEWLGIVVPLAILWWFGRAELRGTTMEFGWLCRALFPFGLAFTVLAVLMAIPERLQNLGRLQPMRSFHVLYAIFYILLGGLLGEYVLRRARWRWVLLFSAIGAGMWVGQRETFPASPHVEWPGVAYQSSWMQAFLWIRSNTPKDAFFALDPHYFDSAGEDEHGFRAVAERNALADELKDSGAVSVFPQLAGLWRGQVDAERGWAHFGLKELQKLARAQGVNWVVLKRREIWGLQCPYQNEGLEVCRLTGN